MTGIQTRFRKVPYKNHSDSKRNTSQRLKGGDQADHENNRGTTNALNMTGKKENVAFLEKGGRPEPLEAVMLLKKWGKSE